MQKIQVPSILFLSSTATNTSAFFTEKTSNKIQGKISKKAIKQVEEAYYYMLKNIHRIQELWKWAHDKIVKPRSYVSSDRVSLNNKYLKTIKSETQG